MKLLRFSTLIGLLVAVFGLIGYSYFGDHMLTIVVENSTGAPVNTKVTVNGQVLLDSLLPSKQFISPRVFVEVPIGTQNVECSIWDGKKSAEHKVFVFMDQWIWLNVGGDFFVWTDEGESSIPLDSIDINFEDSFSPITIE